jgi:hypothetical protein
MIKQNQRYSELIDFSRYINIKPIKYIPPMIKMNPPPYLIKMNPPPYLIKMNPPPYYLKSFIQYPNIKK